MTERLDRIESLLLTTAQQQAVNTSEIDTLLGAVSTNEVGIRALTENVNNLVIRIDESNQRFEVLRQEAIADRQHSDQRFETMQQEAITDRQHSDQHFEVLRQEAITDRQLSNQRFEAMQENLQQLFRELIRTNHRVDNLEQAS